MSDSPAAAAGAPPPADGGSPPAPTLAPTPPVPVPATPPPVAPAVPAAPTELPPLEPGTPIAWTGKDGKEQVANLDELTKRYETTPNLSPGDVEQFQLFQAAAGGDLEASKRLLELGAAATAPTPTVSGEGTPNEVAVLRQELADVKKQLSVAAPTVHQLQNAQEGAMFGKLIQTHKEQLPYLAHHPQGAQRVQAAWREFKDTAAAQNIDLATHPRAREVLAYALQRSEAAFREDAQAFQGFAPANAQAPPPGTEAVMPGPGASAQELPPGAVGVLGNQPIDGYGRPVAAVPTGQPGMPVPSAVPAHSSRAAAPGAEAGMHPDGPMSPEDMQRWVRERANSLTGGGG